jgi:hypothetical protein
VSVSFFLSCATQAVLGSASPVLHVCHQAQNMILQRKVPWCAEYFELKKIKRVSKARSLWPSALLSPCSHIFPQSESWKPEFLSPWACYRNDNSSLLKSAIKPKRSCHSILSPFLLEDLHSREIPTHSQEKEMLHRKTKRIWADRPCWLYPLSPFPLHHVLLSYCISIQLPIVITPKHEHSFPWVLDLHLQTLFVIFKLIKCLLCFSLVRLSSIIEVLTVPLWWLRKGSILSTTKISLHSIARL